MFNETDLHDLGKILINQSQTIAVAESVTAGLLQTALASAENSTNFFQGGITAYNLGQKVRLLNVQVIDAAPCNSVSEKVALQMAKGARQTFMADWGIGITGYATPVPELNIFKLFACVSFVSESAAHATIIYPDSSETLQAQIEYVNRIIHYFKNLLSGTADLQLKERQSF